jgi:hypothetical protein
LCPLERRVVEHPHGRSEVDLASTARGDRHSVSATTGVRDPGGHGISVAVLDQLHLWLADVGAASAP